MSHEMKWLACAMLYAERFGLSVIPMSREEKKPLVCWKPYQERKPTVQEIVGWPKQNLAIVTGAVSGICVIDCESREDAEWFWRERGKSPVVVQTRRGFHFYFRHPGGRVMNGIHIDNRYDVRGDGGYVLAPPSIHSAGAYRWIKPMLRVQDLPVFNPQWRPETRNADPVSDKAISDGAAYIAKIRALAGSGGHNETYRAACCLRASGLSEGEALLAMQEWNATNCEPPWTGRDLLHKVRDAYR